jgi:hypothetical protein
MATTKPPDTWYVFAIAELPVRFGYDYQVYRTANSATGATVDATEILASSGAPVVAALHPGGYVGRVGSQVHLASIPPNLQGVLIRGRDQDFVRLTGHGGMVGW